MPKQDVSIAWYFADLPDPRVERTKKHALGDILVIALCAVIAGADSWEVFSHGGRTPVEAASGSGCERRFVDGHDSCFRFPRERDWDHGVESKATPSIFPSA